jgi:hypothetical protein
MACSTQAANLWFQKRPICGYSRSTRTRKAPDTADAFMANSFENSRKSLKLHGAAHFHPSLCPGQTWATPFRAELEETHNWMAADGSGKMEGGK